MLRRSSRAWMLWSAALVVAVLTATWVGSTLASLRRQDAAFGPVVAYAVARHDLAVGRVVRPGDVTSSRARGGARPPGALTTDAATGRVVAVPVLAGQAVTARHVARHGRAATGTVVPAGRRAMRVAVTDTPRLRAGDHVDVLVTFDPDQVPDDVDPTLTVAEAVPVAAIDPPTTSGDHPTTGVTLVVPERVASRLAYASANGVLALAVVPPEAVTADAPR